MYAEKFAERQEELIGQESISSVARKIKIPQQTLSRYLLCQREIGLENLCKMPIISEKTWIFLQVARIIDFSIKDLV